jgi:hypothetical protein
MFRRIVLLAVTLLAVACLGGARLQAQQNAQQTEPRIAFVVGNAAYAPGALPATLNDAGLVAEALRSIGFEIIEGADLSQADLVRSYREFLAKVEAAGPDALAFAYFSGHALSFEGENYLLGVDARLTRDSDIPIEGVRLSDLMRPLADSPARAKVVIIDAMRPLPFRPQGKGLARGLEAIDPPQGMLVAYASAPGTVAPDQPGNYGPYATAIAEMLRAPGTDLETVFTHIRSRTHLITEGRQTPWHVTALGEQIELLPPEAATASVPPPPPIRQARPMRDIGPDEAYALAIEMDTLEGYASFVQAYPGHPYTQRVWAMIRARREALAWMRALDSNMPQAYWTYLRRYPNGMYAFDAERRLRRLGAAGVPPPGFAMMEFDDVPMALSGEPVEYEEVYRVGPPPPRGLYGAPRPAYLANMPPPQRRGGGAGSRILPALAIAIPLVAALAPAPRRALAPDAPGAGGGNRQGGAGARGGNRNSPAVAPASVTPNQAVAPAPAPVTPNAAIAPSTVTPNTAAPTTPGGNRPPGWGPGGITRPPGVASRPPGGAAPPGAAAPATGTPSAAVTPNSAVPSTAVPSTAAPSTATPNTATPSPGGPPAPGFRRPPGGGPPPGIANRTPPGAPPATPPAAAPNSAAPNPAAAPSTPPAPAAGRPPGRPPGPPPGIANRTPPSVAPPQSGAPPPRPPGPPPQVTPQVNRPPPPPPQVNRAPPPPAIARPTPPAAPVAAPPRPAPPPPPAAAAAVRPPAPPPPRPAAPPPKPPACPPGKTLKVVNGAPTCA